jgi:hypothetical protein
MSSNCAAAISVSLEMRVFPHGTYLAWDSFASKGQHACVVRDKAKTTIQPREENSMKAINLLTIFGVAAALMLSAGSVSAQNDTTGGGNGGGGAGGRGGRNFDPAQMQQRMMERVHDDLGYTNEVEWNAVQPLVQKVMDARRDVGFGGMGRMFRGNRGGGNGANASANANAGGGRGGFGGTPNPDADALQKTIDDNAPKAQIKAALAKYQASQKAKQAKLVAAQENLRKVLNTKQEAQATLLGLLE